MIERWRKSNEWHKQLQEQQFMKQIVKEQVDREEKNQASIVKEIKERESVKS